MKSDTTRRGAADDLDVPVAKTIKRIITVVKDHDPTVEDVSFGVDVHDRALDQGLCQYADECGVPIAFSDCTHP